MSLDAIEEFWSWWPSVADQIDTGIRNGGISQEIIEAMSEHVAAIDPGLDWELGPGRSARHHLCLSAKGDPVLRIVAERWLHCQRADDVWEFYAARQAHAGPALTLEIADQRVPLDGFSYSVELVEEREVVDLGVYHPAFASIEDENLKQRILFIGLDNALGEDGVERWVGGVELLAEAPEVSLSHAEFLAAVQTMADEATGESWAVLQGEIDGKAIVVTLNTALKRVNHLLLDLHVSVELPLHEPSDEGLTTPNEAESLNALEDELFEVLGEHAINVGRETHKGVRTLHFHVMEGGPAASIVNQFQQAHPEYETKVEVSSDPEWSVLQRWT